MDRNHNFAKIIFGSFPASFGVLDDSWGWFSGKTSLRYLFMIRKRLVMHDGVKYMSGEAMPNKFSVYGSFGQE